MCIFFCCDFDCSRRWNIEVIIDKAAVLKASLKLRVFSASCLSYLSHKPKKEHTQTQLCDVDAAVPCCCCCSWVSCWPQLTPFASCDNEARQATERASERQCQRQRQLTQFSRVTNTLAAWTATRRRWPPYHHHPWATMRSISVAAMRHNIAKNIVRWSRSMYRHRINGMPGIATDRASY